MANNVIAIINRVIDAINEMFHISFNGLSILGKEVIPSFNVRLANIPHVPTFATGGFPEDGLFYANHSELVGQFSNGRTAVANNEQIVEGISEGVRDANTDVVTAIVSGVSQIINAMNENAQNGGGLTLDNLASALWNPMQHQNSVHGSSLVAYSR